MPLHVLPATHASYGKWHLPPSATDQGLFFQFLERIDWLPSGGWHVISGVTYTGKSRVAKQSHAALQSADDGWWLFKSKVWIPEGLNVLILCNIAYCTFVSVTIYWPDNAELFFYALSDPHLTLPVADSPSHPKETQQKFVSSTKLMKSF